MREYLHIVCLDAPSPPDYGGAIDMYFKIKALAETGKKIILHYFHYKASRNSKGLKDFCQAIYTYKRKNLPASLPGAVPHIIQSRINKELIARLNEDEYPILLEGLHCSGILPFLKNKTRVIVRMHNDEALYYHHLAQTEKNVFKRKYFEYESRLLKKYVSQFPKDCKLACLSETDRRKFESVHGFANTFFIPCFIPWQNLAIKKGKGNYCLYHGNLSVSENEQAAYWLIKNIFSGLNVPLVIAGKGISKALQIEAKPYTNITIATNPSIEQIDRLVAEAQVNVLPSMNATGVKLKLLNAVLNGRYCITNNNGIMGSEIREGVIIAETISSWQEAVTACMNREFSENDISIRRKILWQYNNQENARKLSALW